MPTFRLNGSRLLEVDINGESFKALNGSMVAYDGQVDFKRQGMTGGGGGIRGAMKRKIAGESVTLMDCVGSGTVYVANAAQEITLIQLAGDTLFVESDNLLALEASVTTDVKFTGFSGATTGQGLATTTVTGQGTIAITSDGPAIALEVAPGMPVCVDPQAYVAHKGQLQQQFIRDMNWRMALGEGTGEAFQIRFDGQGIVYIQPAERSGGLDI